MTSRPKPLISASVALSAAIIASVALSAACASTAPSEAPPDEVLVVEGSPAYPEAPDGASWPLDPAPDALIRDVGRIYGIHGGGAYRLSEAGPEALSTWPADLETGELGALARHMNGPLIAGGQGLFQIAQGVIAASSLGQVTEGFSVHDLHADGAGAVWIAAEEGLYRIDEVEALLVEIEAAEGPPLKVAANAEGVLVAYGASTWHLDPETWTAARAPLTEAPLDLAATPTVLAAGAESGLWILEGAVWSHYPLDGSPAYALATDIRAQLLVQSAGGLALVKDGALEGLVALESSGGGVALDGQGRAWLPGAGGVVAYEVAEPVGFARDIAPIFEVSCNSCHGEGASAPKHDFADYDEVVALSEAVLERVFTGQMPPGLPLAEREYDLIEVWYEGGLLP